MDDGFEYYSYILWYVDVILVIHNDSMSVLKKIDKYFKLNHHPLVTQIYISGPK